MPLHEWLAAGRVAIIDAPGDRGGVIDTAARLLARPERGDPATEAGAGEEIRTSLQAREQLASTAMGHGVAFPHGRVRALECTRAAFLRLDEPVDFGAIDGEPVDLVLAMAVPEHALQEHLQQMAELAGQFGDAGFRATLRGATDTDALRRLLLPAVPAAS